MSLDSSHFNWTLILRSQVHLARSPLGSSEHFAVMKWLLAMFISMMARPSSVFTPARLVSQLRRFKSTTWLASESPELCLSEVDFETRKITLPRFLILQHQKLISLLLTHCSFSKNLISFYCDVSEGSFPRLQRPSSTLLGA
jgi:hypothetical protein